MRKYYMKVTVKGQVTIPKHIRRFLGISAYSEVEFAIKDEEVVLVKASDDTGDPDSNGGRFGKLRGLKKGKLTTDAWMAATRGD